MKLLRRLIKNKPLLYGLLLITCLVTGLFLAYANYREGIDMGDSSTFFIFGRNMSHGEVPFKDFIHFRTPGTVALHGLFIKLFGEKASSSRLATYFEISVLFNFLFVLSAIIIYRKTQKVRYPFFALIGIVFMPAVAQLRCGLGLLAIACYIASFDSRLYSNRWRWLAGLLTGITFIFGQEIALIVGVCMVASECIGGRFNKDLWKQSRPLILGAIIGVLPLIIYIIAFSNFTTFIYYVTYYSFIRQPKYMDLPFPTPGYYSLLFYLPFILYALCFFVIYANQKLGKKEAVLLSFGILRLITALGRADIGHLIFSMPEIFIIVPYLLSKIQSTTINTKNLQSFMPYGGLVVLLFIASMLASGIFLFPVPFVMLYALHTRKIRGGKSKLLPSLNYHLYFGLGGSLLLILYILFPSYYNVIRASKQGIVTRNAAAPRIGGVKVDPVIYDEIQEVQNVSKSIKPKTVFTFPIQPYYYTLAPQHASRYMTFEPQTTIKEQDLTIKDLERTKPELIIFDPLQAQGLSGSLWKISDYITSHYEIKHEVMHKDILWVMVPKSQSQRNDKLVYQLYKNNRKIDGSGIQSTAKGINNAILQQNAGLAFTFDNMHNAQLHLSISKPDGADVGDCGRVLVRYTDDKTQDISICASDGRKSIALQSTDRPLSIELQKPSGYPVIWNDVTISE